MIKQPYLWEGLIHFLTSHQARLAFYEFFNLFKHTATEKGHTTDLNPWIYYNTDIEIQHSKCTSLSFLLSCPFFLAAKGEMYMIWCLHFLHCSFLSFLSPYQYIVPWRLEYLIFNEICWHTDLPDSLYITNKPSLSPHIFKFTKYPSH